MNIKLTFHIRYCTAWGENLYVILKGDEEHAVPLATRNGTDWGGSCDYALPAETLLQPTLLLDYRYAVYRNGVCIRREIGRIPHFVVVMHQGMRHYFADDCWRDLPSDAYRYASPFITPAETEGRQLQSASADDCGSGIQLRALCPGLGQDGLHLGVSGSCEALGQWNVDQAIPMRELLPGVWNLILDDHQTGSSFEYKFVLLDTAGKVRGWEDGNNRFYRNRTLMPGEMTLPMETEVDFHLPDKRMAGCAIPLFSLRSEKGWGVGDFGDLKTFVDWVEKTHQKVVQLLPINDTCITGTWTDSYPYNSISIYAFHPMYVDLRQLPPLEDRVAAARMEKQRLQVNALPQVDYEAVNHLKLAYLKQSFKEQGTKVLRTPEFLKFFDGNKHWLQPYAAFCYLRDRFHTANFNEWTEHAIYRPAEIHKLCQPQSKEYPLISFYYYVQFLLSVQLQAVALYARSKGIILKGDIPIGISRYSVEAWAEPYYFNLNGQAGAPPDPFSANGQNWGFPTYDWEVMAKDDYSWWRKRLANMSRYFAAYRIDHILGFFRIWEIPSDAVHGLLGQFVPALPMDADEINHFGLHFDAAFMTQPFIDDDILESLFGNRMDEVRQTFLFPIGEDRYALRPQFDTQKKIEAYFAGKNDPESVDQREKLYRLISNVLFVPDRREAGKYHPRIAVQDDFVFARLSEESRQAFNKLYDHYFYHRHNDFWYAEAMKKLPVLTQSTPMLACGEDLGMVPACVPWLMNRLQILSLEVQRMSKDPHSEFGHVHDYPFLSVCTIGTHDMSTLRGWWEEDPAVTARYYHHELQHAGEVPAHAEGWLCQEIVNMHLYSPSMLCILAWQDWLSMDDRLRNPDIEAERINVPADPKHYWRWRMHLTLEELLEADGFNGMLRGMIDASGRFS